MRIGYACRDLASERSTGSGVEFYARACAAAAAGHEAYLISASLAPRFAPVSGPVHVPLAPARPGYRYPTDSLAYADRVYDTVRGLDLDVLEIVDTAGEAYTVVRAKRLLGEFGSTRLVVATNPPATEPAVGEPAASLDEAVDRHLEEYCRRHALVSDGTALLDGGTAPSTVDCPLVTVVIPVHDQGGYLGEAVASARACGYSPLEIVVVDDGSTDPQTLAVLDDLTGVRLVRQPNRGLPAARNAGIAAARGEYVVPLDADDLVPPGFVPAGVRALQRLADLGCVGGTVHHFGLLDHVGSPVGYVPDVSLVVNTFGRATAVFRTNAVRAVGGYDESLPGYEDWDLYLRLHKAGYAVEYAPLPAQHYRRHAESMTFQQDGPARLALTQRLLRTHADLLGDGAALPLLLTLVQLWKSRYEPSASVVLRDGLALAGHTLAASE